MKKINFFFYSFIFVFFMFALVLISLGDWFAQRFGIQFEEIVYTLLMPKKGADTDFLHSAVEYVLPSIIVTLGLCVLVAFFDRKIFSVVDGKIHVILAGKIEKVLSLSHLYRLCLSLTAIGIFSYSIFYVEKILSVKEYLLLRKSSSPLIEDHYVPPESVSFSVEGEYKNLIFIVMESMEVSYASKENGGLQADVNYIPNLTSLAKRHISFKGGVTGNSLSGLHTTSGSGWTMASLFAMTSGLPFKFPIEGNSMDQVKSFAPRLTVMGDILEAAGYTNEFICGSDGNFGGRKSYFEQHGNYVVFDLYTARERGYIPSDYSVFWGFEDEILYKIAKDEVGRLAKASKPFNLTLLTVDTHHIGGYVCGICDDEYSEPLGNVIKCADKQVADFILWCEEQTWYDDTVIIVVGDHPRMDTILLDDANFLDRALYNCFINVDVDSTVQTANRVISPMDIFPSVLWAIGFRFEGNRLGLGTNIFSNKETWAEEVGFEDYNLELGKYSQYFIDKAL